ncbi:MAG: hypothetical protein HQM11_18930 [SAR324 cluster bacterium]|nr:hypothetical protein [SAR324 cluster bacterium]
MSNLRYRISSFIVIFCIVLAQTSHALPLKTEILNDKEQPVAKVLVYIDFVEILDMSDNLQGKVGIFNNQGNLELFIVKEDNLKSVVGRAFDRKLYDANDQLVGYYDWSTFWVYAYSPTGKKLGQAKCIAFRGVCAAGVATYLTELLTKPLVTPGGTPNIAQPETIQDGGVTLE